MAKGKSNLQNISTAYQPGLAIRYIFEDTVRRLHIILYRISCLPVFIIALIPKATALPATTDQSSNSNTSAVTGGQSSSHSNTSIDPDSIAAAKRLVDEFVWREWSNVATSIRTGPTRLSCYENLNSVLSHIGPLAAASNSAGCGALTLLPTAGALIGSPTKELWVVYKLMPLAGILSMLLSLGGSIVPSNASDYELNPATFSYGGLIATEHEEPKVKEPKAEEPKAKKIEDQRSGPPGAHAFATKIKIRAGNLQGGTKYGYVWCGIVLQCLLIIVLFFACWFTQSGAILLWWCQAGGWMFLWYSMVALASLLENWASVPFTNQWTLRISRAPRVKISDDAPFVTSSSSSSLISVPTNEHPDGINHQKNSTPNAEIHEDVPLIQTPPTNGLTAVLDGLKSGYNCKGKIFIDEQKGWSSSLVPFYVIISVDSISTAHAILRVISKSISVGVFAAGTAIFASAQLVSITVAVTTLCLVLAAGVFGRVVAMWMASEMMKTNPVFHRVVRTKELASQYIEEILKIDGLTVEVHGHIIINGQCVARYNRSLRWASLFGILAEPYDVSKLAA